MVIEVVIPILDQAGGEFTLAKWLKREGDDVHAGDALCEIETSKANVEITAEASGVLRQILIPEGATLAPLTVIALIGDADEPLPEVDPFYRVRQPPPPAPHTLRKSPLWGYIPPMRYIPQGRQGKPSKDATGEGPGEGPGEGVIASPRARKLAAEHTIDLATVVGTGPDGRIVEEDVRRAIEQKS